MPVVTMPRKSGPRKSGPRESRPSKSRPSKTGPRKIKPGKPPDSQAILSTRLGATLHELCCYLSAASVGQSNQDPLSEEECAALAAAALGGHAEAEFLVGSVFDAAHDPGRAMEWYRRSARGGYAPAQLQLLADR